MKTLILLFAAAALAFVLFVCANQAQDTETHMQTVTNTSAYVNESSNGCNLVGQNTCSEWNNGVTKINQMRQDATNQTNNVVNQLSDIFGGK